MTRKLGMLVLIGTIVVTAQALGNGSARNDCPPGCCSVPQACAPCPDAPSCPMPCAPGAAESDVATLSVE